MRLLREHRGKSRPEIGAAIDVSPQQVDHYEKGRDRISAGRLKRLADVLDVPTDWFFSGAPLPSNVPGARYLAAAERVMRSLEMLNFALATTVGKDGDLRQARAALEQKIATAIAGHRGG